MIKQYDASMDAQKVYQGLLAYYTTSQSAELRAEALMSKIINAAMPSELTKERTEYIAEFRELIRRYNMLVDSATRLSDNAQVQHIKRFAASCPQLQHTKVSIETNTLMSGMTISPLQAMEALEYSARAADHQDKEVILGQRARSNKNRRAYSTARQNDHMDDDTYIQQHWHAYQVLHSSAGAEMGEYDNDGGNKLEAFRAQQERSYPRNGNDARGGNTRIRLDREAWGKMSPQDRSLFQQLSDDGTCVVYDFCKELASKRSQGPPPTPSGPTRDTRRAHFTDTGDDEDIGEEAPTPHDDATDIPPHGRRSANVHHISTAYHPPFGSDISVDRSKGKPHAVNTQNPVERIARDVRTVLNADLNGEYTNPLTCDLEPTHPLRLLSEPTTNGDDSSVPPLVQRDESDSSANEDDSFNDGEGIFKKVVPKKKTTRKKKKKKNSNKKTSASAPVDDFETTVTTTPTVDALPVRSTNNYEFLRDEFDNGTDSGVDESVPLRQANTVNVTQYHVSKQESRFRSNVLVDRGANGVVGGADLRKISECSPARSIDVTGLDDHMISNLKIGSYGGVVMSNRGPILLIFHECAGYNKGKTIISALQVEDNDVTVDDRPIGVGGTQSLRTLEGYSIPMDVINGLCYIKLRPFTDDEYLDLPHVEMTRDVEWDPSKFDRNLTQDRTWMARQPDPPPIHPGFDHEGNYLRRADILDRGLTSKDSTPPPPPPHPQSDLEYIREKLPLLVNINELHHSHFAHRRTRPRDPNDFRKYFLGMPASVVSATLDSTTQFYHNIGSDAARIIDTHKSLYTGSNVRRRNENLACDTMVPDTIGWGGVKLAQLFVGRKSRHISVWRMRRESEFPGVLEDVIRRYGAPDTLVSDMAKAEISNRVKDLLRKFCVDDWNSEPHYQWQNYAERIIQEMKKYVNWVLNTSGAPPEAWFFALEYVVFIWNRTARKSLDFRTPHEAIFGSTPDISVLLQFEFWEPVLIQNYRPSAGFPSESTEIAVRVVGYAENVGHDITFKVWNEETQQLLFRSRLKKFSDLHFNRRVIPSIRNDPLPPPEPPPAPKPIRDVVSIMHEKPGQLNEYRAATLKASDLVGRTYLKPVEENGERYRAKIVGYIEEFEGDLQRNPERVRFKTEVGDAAFEEIVQYNEVCDFIEEQLEDDDGTWRFREIINHRVTKGKKEVLIVWESGERTWEPASEIFRCDKYELAKYCKEADILDEWSTTRMNLKKLAKREKNLLRVIKQAKLRSHRTAIVYSFGFQVPRNHQQALDIDAENGNRKWQDSEELEIKQLYVEYNSFRDIGHKSVARPPPGYKRITLHFVYAVKHDGRHKSRLVAGGHLTDTPLESVYAGVVSLRGVRLVVFLAELNELELWQTDIGNAYLEAKTTEKVFVVAGPEFKSFGLEGHVLIIVTSIYGLKSSGARWHDRLADVMRDMGFSPCKAEPDIWMRECNADGNVVSGGDTSTNATSYASKGSDEGNSTDGHYYEYVAVYTDDLTIASKNPKDITGALEKVYKFKLKGTAPLNFLLGCDYYRDSHGVLCQQPKKYIEKMEETHLRLFGTRPKHATSPLVKGDHPECDTSEFLDERGIKIYQSMIGSAQWIIQLGRFDIAVHVMSLSSFRAEPRQGHLDRIKRVYGYVSKMKDGAIRYRTGMPDVSDLKFAEQDWSQSAYAGSKEEVPQDMPRALGKSVRLITYGDANLCHDLLSGKAVTGLLHFINKTPFDWYSKKQNTTETATYGAESVAGRTAIEQLRANKLTLHYLGVPIEGASILIGDNKTAVDAATLPESRLHKRHLMLSFHFLKSAIATGAYKYVWADGKDNASDVLTKHWGYQQVWPILRPVLFWKGDTLDIIRKSC